jgi:DNA-binding MarR family transcriptional regulator
MNNNLEKGRKGPVDSERISSEQLNADNHEPSKRSYELQILKSLRAIIRATDIYSRRLALTYHITAPQLLCMLTVTAKDAITVSKLAREINLSASTVVGILNRLEQKGLVTRERDTKDRRIVFVRLTDEGRNLIRNAPTPLQDSLSKALQQLSEENLAHITGALEQLVSMMEIEEKLAAPILTTGSIPERDLEKQHGEDDTRREKHGKSRGA